MKISSSFEKYDFEKRRGDKDLATITDKIPVAYSFLITLSAIGRVTSVIIIILVINYENSRVAEISIRLNKRNSPNVNIINIHSFCKVGRHLPNVRIGRTRTLRHRQLYF